MPAATKPGFQKPVGAVIRLRLDRLRRMIKSEAPKGKPRPRSIYVGGKRYTYRKAYTPGKLKKAFDKRSSVTLSRTGNSIQINVDHTQVPHARIQDKGGRIPPHVMPKGKYMMLPRGPRHFISKRRGFRLKGQNYIRRAVDKWKADRQKSGALGGLNVRWARRPGVTLEP